ncbi:MAG TPA: response regulator transcription factor [Jatrophihabitans sp.]|jgi:two-component system response regulator DevR
MTRVIRVVLVDDHEVVRRGLATVFHAADDIAVVGEADSVATALETVRRLRPEVVLLDVRLPDASGIDACREITSTTPARCLMLTSHDDDDAIFAAVMSGASGYLLKDVAAKTLLDAVRQVGAGRSLLDPTVTSRVFDRLRNGEPPADPVDSLNGRELQLLDLIAEGLTNRQIATRMFLAEKTVKNYVSALLAKLGYERRTQIAVLGASRRRKSGDGTLSGRNVVR